MNSRQRRSAQTGTIQRQILDTLLILVSVMTVLITIISIIVSIYTDRTRLDQNLENIAQAVAQSQIIRDKLTDGSIDGNMTESYLDSLKSSLTNIDVISVISSDTTQIMSLSALFMTARYPILPSATFSMSPPIQVPRAHRGVHMLRFMTTAEIMWDLSLR